MILRSTALPHHRHNGTPEYDGRGRWDGFAVYLNDASLDSRQIYFVNQIVEYIVHNGVLKDRSVLQEPPFTDRGSVVDIFTDVTVWLGIRAVIDQINANAAARTK